MTLKEWRLAKEWSQNYLAMVLSKHLGTPISQQNIHAWETGTVPNAVVGEAIRKMTGGRVTGDSFGKTSEPVGAADAETRAPMAPL